MTTNQSNINEVTTNKSQHINFQATNINQELTQKLPRNFNNTPTNSISPTILNNSTINSNLNATNNSTNNNTTNNTFAQINFPASFAQEPEQNLLESPIVNFTNSISPTITISPITDLRWRNPSYLHHFYSFF
jgi:hypothetical protein